jgi:hypothetical protein
LPLRFRICITRVDFPAPGGPARSTDDPGTKPPPIRVSIGGIPDLNRGGGTVRISGNGIGLEK